jgi:hypothetical protein
VQFSKAFAAVVAQRAFVLLTEPASISNGMGD